MSTFRQIGARAKTQGGGSFTNMAVSNQIIAAQPMTIVANTELTENVGYMLENDTGFITSVSDTVTTSLTSNGPFAERLSVPVKLYVAQRLLTDFAFTQNLSGPVKLLVSAQLLEDTRPTGFMASVQSKLTNNSAFIQTLATPIQQAVADQLDGDVAFINILLSNLESNATLLSNLEINLAPPLKLAVASLLLNDNDNGGFIQTLLTDLKDDSGFVANLSGQVFGPSGTTGLVSTITANLIETIQSGTGLWGQLSTPVQIAIANTVASQLLGQSGPTGFSASISSQLFGASGTTGLVSTITANLIETIQSGTGLWGQLSTPVQIAIANTVASQLLGQSGPTGFSASISSQLFGASGTTGLASIITANLIETIQSGTGLWGQLSTPVQIAIANTVASQLLGQSGPTGFSASISSQLFGTSGTTGLASTITANLIETIQSGTGLWDQLSTPVQVVIAKTVAEQLLAQSGPTGFSSSISNQIFGASGTTGLASTITANLIETIQSGTGLWDGLTTPVQESIANTVAEQLLAQSGPTAFSSSISNQIFGASGTNNIQAKTLGAPVRLYTNFDNLITLGGSLVSGIVISSLASLLAYVTIQTKYFSLLSTDGVRSLKTIFDTANIVQEFFADTANNTKTAQITVAPNVVTPTIDNTGSYRIFAGSLNVPNTIVSNTPSSIQNVFASTTGEINFGTASTSVNIKSTTLTTPNKLVSSIPASTQSLYTETTFPINIGTASSSVNILSTSLTTPNTIVSEAIGSEQALFATTTSPINIGTASSSVNIRSTSLTTPNTLVSNTTGSIQNVFATTTSPINIGTSSSAVHILSTSLTTPNTIVSETLGSEQALFATTTSPINIGTASSSVNIRSTSLTTPNTLVSNTTGSIQNVFATTTSPINIGTSSSAVNILSTSLTTPNTIVSEAIGSAQALFATTTSPINIGTASSSVNILSTSLTTPNTLVSNTTESIQNVFGTTTGEIRIGGASSGISLLSSVLANSIVAVDPASSIVTLFNNFTSGSTSTVTFGNNFLASLTSRAISLITYFDTYKLRSNTNANQRIEQSFPSTTTHTQSYFIDNSNTEVETCRISVSQGSTPLINNKGQLTMTGGQIGVIGDTVNLSNTGASSVINVNAQLKPAYAYNTDTGVSNPSAIGYTKFGNGSTDSTLESDVNVTRSTISISVDGVYQINHCNAVIISPGSNFTYIRSYVQVINGFNVFQCKLAASNITYLNPYKGDTCFMNGSGVFTVTGATALNPFKFDLILSQEFETITFASYASNNVDFRFSVTRIA